MSSQEQSLKQLRLKMSEWMVLYEQLKETATLSKETATFLEQIRTVMPAINKAILAINGGMSREQGKTVDATTLEAAVGKGGKNKKVDVLLVQKLLNKKYKADLVEDGLYGRNTLNAIVKLQKKIFNGWADGLISVGGKTWKTLSKGVAVEQNNT
ncbi:MAG: hypothetical protein MK212_21985, partial [Saprospiraceae bacterium]|nr:hypothetical protein [Saprospiraceae bacterium]